MVESGSDPSKVHRTVPSVNGGGSVNAFLKPASGMSVCEVACAISAMRESVLMMPVSFVSEESVLMLAEPVFM